MCDFANIVIQLNRKADGNPSAFRAFCGNGEGKLALNITRGENGGRGDPYKKMKHACGT